ncbi:uncharacterized protein LOC132690150 isoform X2 [Panthera onca]
MPHPHPSRGFPRDPDIGVGPQLHRACVCKPPPPPAPPPHLGRKPTSGPSFWGHGEGLVGEALHAQSSPGLIRREMASPPKLPSRVPASWRGWALCVWLLRSVSEMDPAQNAALLTVGNASPADEGTYYCAIWFSGQYVFGEGTQLLYQAKRQPLALQPPELSLFIPAYGPPFHVLCVALGHNPDPLRVSWVLEGQYQEEEDSTGGAGDPMVSWLQLPQEVAGMSVTCRGLHQSGALEVVLPLPWGRGHRRTLEVENANKSGHILLVELEQILNATTYCYLGLLGASLIYGLILAALWRNRCCWAHATEPLPRGGQGAAPGSRAQVGRRCTPAAAPEHKWPSPRGFHVLRGAAHAPDPPSLLRLASS